MVINVKKQGLGVRFLDVDDKTKIVNLKPNGIFYQNLRLIPGYESLLPNDSGTRVNVSLEVISMETYFAGRTKTYNGSEVGAKGLKKALEEDIGY